MTRTWMARNDTSMPTRHGYMIANGTPSISSTSRQSIAVTVCMPHYTIPVEVESRKSKVESRKGKRVAAAARADRKTGIVEEVLVRKLIAAVLVALACGVAPATSAWAQAGYPTKPIRIISPFPAGGSVDLVARMVAAKLPDLVGQQVVVENRSGASGNIGTEVVARAAPDGYTLLLNTIPFVANTFFYGKLP